MKTYVIPMTYYFVFSCYIKSSKECLEVHGSSMTNSGRT